MNSNTLITDGQSLADVATQELGGVAALFDLADANGLAITDTLAAGQVLAVPAAPASQAVADYFAGRQQRINTGDVPATVVRRRRFFSDAFFNSQFYS